MTQQNPVEIPIPLKERIIGLRDLQISPDGRWLATFGGPSKTPIEIVPNNRYVDSVESPFPIENVFLDGNYFHEHPYPLPPYQVVRLSSTMQTMPSANKTEAAKISNDISLEAAGKVNLLESLFLSQKNIQVSYNLESPPISSENRPIGLVAVTESATAFSEPNTIWLWDLQQIYNGFVPPPILLRGLGDEIGLIQFSPDSSKLAVGYKNSTAQVYNLRETKTDSNPIALRGHHLDITAFAFTPDGNWLATGSRDNTIRLWNLTDTATHKTPESVVLNGHLGWISSLVIDETGTKLYSGSYDKTIRIWNLDRTRFQAVAEKEALVLQSHQGAIRELSLSPDGKKLISLSGDGSLQIRNIDGILDERHSIILRNRTLPISKAAVTPNNRWLVFGYTNQRNPSNSGVRLWPLNLDHLIQLVSE
jgi:WD40 repeat protein